MKINYPNKKSSFKKIKQFANRGMRLETIINETNLFYLHNDRAVIHKKPTPIQVVKINNSSKGAIITEAFFKSPSTTDYNGIYRGKYIDFEAKETNNKTSFPLRNISEHQIKHLAQVEKHGAIAFLIIAFNYYEEYYILKASIVAEHYFNNKKRSIPYSVIKEKGWEIENSYLNRLMYLDVIDEHYF